MNTKTVVAVILITLGIVVLAYSGFSFRLRDNHRVPWDHLETMENHFIPPIVGVFALIGGIVLLLVNPKRD